MSKFKENLEDIIKKNEGARFVVHPTSNEERNDVFSVMKDIGIIALGPADLDEYRKNAENGLGDDAAFEFNLSTMITSFGTVEHWKQYTKDIIEWDGEKFFFLVD
jgi:hypothetical protein